MLLACVDGGLICIPAAMAAAVGLGAIAWLRRKTCEDHCDHCPGEHESEELVE